MTTAGIVAGTGPSGATSGTVVSGEEFEKQILAYSPYASGKNAQPAPVPAPLNAPPKMSPDGITQPGGDGKANAVAAPTFNPDLRVTPYLSVDENGKLIPSQKSGAVAPTGPARPASTIPIATLMADASNAQLIATRAGNKAGVVFTTAVTGVLSTIAASGGKNSGDTIEAAAIGLGKTTTEFMKLVGEGDIAAFGVVIGDLGGVLNGLQGGQPGKLLSSSFSTVGDTIKAFGLQNNDKGQQLTGTVLSGTGSFLAGLNSGKPGGGTAPGLAFAGSLATSFANMPGGSKELAALGAGLQGAGTVADYFNKGQNLLGQGAIASTIGTVAGGLIGGETGQKVAIGGDLVNNAFGFAANSVPGAASGNVLSIGLDALQLLGVKIDPGVTSLSSLAASALAGPVGWVSAGIQIIGSLFNMGDHNKDVTLQENVNATGRIMTSSADKATDKVSVLDHTNIGFLNIGSSHSSTIQYDVTGVSIDPRLLKDVQYSIVPESYTTKQQVQIATTGRMQTPTEFATATLDDGSQLSGKIVKTYPAGSEDATDIGYVQPLSTKFVASDGRQFDMVGQAMGRSGSNMAYRLVVPTGNSTLSMTANYNSINPTTGSATGTTKATLNAADAARYVQALGGSSGTFGGGEATKIAALKPQLDSQSLRFKGKENDPTYAYYADVNGDKMPDRISISLKVNGLERQGDGSVTVTLLDKDRNTLGQPVVANETSDMTANLKAVSGKLTQMLKTEQLRPLLSLYTAAHPEIWEKGKDYTSVANTLKESGVLPELEQAQALNSEIARALVTPGGDVGALITQLRGVVNDLKLDFNPAQYAAANPDLAKAYGTDSKALTDHYIATGNNEGRLVTADGAKLSQYVPPFVRGMTNLGPSITNGEIRKGEALVSANGAFVASMQQDGNFVVYNTATGAPIWDSSTYAKSHSGFLGIGGWSDSPGDRVSLQGGGHLVVYDANNTSRWETGAYNTNANRNFKLIMQDDGNLVVYDSQKGASKWNNPEGGPVLWASQGGLQQKPADGDGSAPAFAALVPKPITYGNTALQAGTDRMGSSATLNSLQYVASYTDLIREIGDDAKAGKAHMESLAVKEGRKTTFSAMAYLNANPDISALVKGDPVKATQYYIASQALKGSFASTA